MKSKLKTKFSIKEQVVLDVFFSTLDKFFELWQGNAPDVSFDTWLRAQAEEYKSLKKTRKEKK